MVTEASVFVAYTELGYRFVDDIAGIFPGMEYKSYTKNLHQNAGLEFIFKSSQTKITFPDVTIRERINGHISLPHDMNSYT